MRDVTLVSCTESIDETPSGMVLHGIMSSINEFHSRNLASDDIKGSTQKEGLHPEGQRGRHRRRTVTSVADDSDELTEEQYEQQLRTFRTHAAVFAAANLGIFLVNLAINLAAGIADIWWAWWSAWSIIGWGIGLAVHGLVVRGQRPAPQGR